MRGTFVPSGFMLAGVAAAFMVACPLDERRMLLFGADDGAAGELGEAGDGGVSSGGTSGSNSKGGNGESGDTGKGGDAGGGSGNGSGGSTSGGVAGSGTAGGGGSGAGSGGAAGGGMGGRAGAGGAGGAGATAACPDLDRNGKPDCDETLVMNPAFDDDAMGWRTETDVDQSWGTKDARNVAESGSIVVTNRGYHPESSGTGMAGSEQCIPVTGGKAYRAVVEAFIQPGQGDGVSAGVSLLFFTSNDCSGTSAFSPSTTTFATDQWTLVDLPAAAPAGARSIKMRLVAIKPFRLMTFAASFDNVLLRADD